MPSDFKEDQAEELRKHFEDNNTSSEIEEDIIDVLSLPSRKEKYKKIKPDTKVQQQEKSDKKSKRKRRRVRFPLVRVLLILFLLLVVLVLTYPTWMDRLNL
jgi:uncharacterized membrane protein